MPERKEALHVAIQALEEIQQYREMEKRLQNVYGTCDGLLEKVVSHLEKHENTELPEPVFKAKLLIDDEVDRWESYKTIGTVEECRESMEKQKAVWEPEYLWTNTLNGCISGKCMCGNLVRSYYAFCNRCGTRLEWDNVYLGNRDV